MHLGNRCSLSILIHGSIVLPGGIYVLMAKSICHQIDVLCFLVKIRTKGAAQLMRRDFLYGCDKRRVLFDQALYGAGREAGVLQGNEQGVLMAGSGREQCP